MSLELHAETLAAIGDDDTLLRLLRRAQADGIGTAAGRLAAWTLASALVMRLRDGAAHHLACVLGRPFPADARLLLTLSPAVARAGDTGLAAAMAEAAVDLIPAGTDAAAAALAARAYRALAATAGIGPALRRAAADAAAMPDSAAHAAGRGRLLTFAHRHDEALAAFADCRRLDPDSLEHAIAYGDAALRAAPPAAALAATLDARRQWPTDPTILFQASRALKQAGQVAEAIEAALAAFAAMPQPRGIHAHLIGLLLRAGRVETALDIAEQALSGQEAPPDLGPIGLLLRAAAGQDRARDLARRMLRAKPNLRDAPLLVALAGLRSPLSSEPVARTLVIRGLPPPEHVVAAFAGKGHALHSGKRPTSAAADVELVEMQDVTLNVFPYGFAVTDAQGLPHGLASPALHPDLIDQAAQLPLLGSHAELFFAADGKFAANNYCHWLLDYLPRILWASRLKPAAPIGITGITMTGFRAASLAHIRFDTSRLVDLPSGRYRVKRLAMLSNSDHRFFRNALHGGNAAYAAPLIEAFPPPPGPGRRRVFVTRPPGQGRSFTNYEEVMAVVQAAGFEVLDPGRHPFSEQVRIMGEAAAVAGPHGAGLTNLLFCPTGTKVLEIFPRDNGTMPFAMLSAVRDHHYDVLVGDEPDLTSIAGIDGNRADFGIDAARLAAALAGLRAAAEQAGSA